MIDNCTLQKIDKTFKNFFTEVSMWISNESKEWINYLKKWAEEHSKYIFNKVYGYNLEKCAKINQEKIDLYDKVRHLWLQVTWSKKKGECKVVIENPFSKEFPEIKTIKFFFLNFDSSNKFHKNWIDLNNEYFRSEEDIITLFNLKQDIMNKDINDLIDIIITFNTLFPEKFKELISYLNSVTLSNNDLKKIKDMTNMQKKIQF